MSVYWGVLSHFPFSSVLCISFSIPISHSQFCSHMLDTNTFSFWPTVVSWHSSAVPPLAHTWLLKLFNVNFCQNVSLFIHRIINQTICSYLSMYLSVVLTTVTEPFLSDLWPTCAIVVCMSCWIEEKRQKKGLGLSSSSVEVKYWH